MRPPEKFVSWSSGGKVVFSSSPWLIFNVSCLSFMAASKHKDVAPLSYSCIVRMCGPALSQNSIVRPHNLGLMSVHLEKNKSSSHASSNASIKNA